MAYQIFGDSIDYSRVRVHKNAHSDNNRAHKSSLYMTQASYRDDYATSRNSQVRSIFIHELAHIWQSHNGKDLVGEAVGLFFRHGGDYDRAYDYDLFDLNNFENLSIEQQASIIEDYFYLDLVNFVEQMAQVSGGVAAYCNAQDLGNMVIDSFVDGRRKRQTM